MIKRVPSKKSSFEQIISMGIPINKIIDVGVQTCTKSLIHCFPDKEHILFEPVEEWHKYIEQNYKNIKYILHKIALSNNNEDSFLETSSVNQSKITHARLNPNPQNIDSCRRIVTKKLDSIIKNYEKDGPYLLKLDVDGAEIAILEGATQTLECSSVVVIEAHPRDFLERSNFLMSRNFLLLDMVDLCYYEGTISQFDMIFVNRKFLKRYRDNTFDIKKWYEYTPEGDTVCIRNLNFFL